MDLLKHLRVNCPKCGENHDLFTTSGVLPELTDCKTGRCKKCDTDFYYMRGSCWFETFTKEELDSVISEMTIENQNNFGQERLDEKTIADAVNYVNDNFSKP